MNVVKPDEELLVTVFGGWLASHLLMVTLGRGSLSATSKQNPKDRKVRSD